MQVCTQFEPGAPARDPSYPQMGLGHPGDPIITRFVQTFLKPTGPCTACTVAGGSHAIASDSVLAIMTIT